MEKKTGFTLIELAVVVIVMSILATLVIPRLMSRLASDGDELAQVEFTVELDAGDGDESATPEEAPRGTLPDESPRDSAS